VPLTNLCLYIQQLPYFKEGKPLQQEIPANQRYSFKIIIPQVPELPLNQENNLFLSGELSFRFAESETTITTLAPESQITIKQIFSSGFDINEFL